MSGIVCGYEESKHEDEERQREEKSRIKGYKGEYRHCGDGLDWVPPCQNVFDLILYKEYHAHSKTNRSAWRSEEDANMGMHTELRSAESCES